MAALPVPDDADAMVSQGVPLTAVHAHPAPMPSWIACVLAAADVSIVSGLTVGTQFGAGGGVGPGATAADWETTTCLSAIAMTPVRRPPSLADTWTSNPPDPVAVAAGTWIHEAVVVARHEQPTMVVTVIRWVPPPPSMSTDVGSRSNVQGRAA